MIVTANSEWEAFRSSETSGTATAGATGIGAALQSTRRGHIDPPGRQKMVLTGAAGRTVRQKMRWLFYNVGYVAIATRIAAWEGPVRPDPDTGDAEYNRILRDWWQETQEDVTEYDLSGKFTAESYQEMLEAQQLVLGDGLSVFRQTRDGAPTVRFYDALAVDNPLFFNNQRDWIDGVKVDRDHRHLAYRLVRDDLPGYMGAVLDDEVDAANAHFHAVFQHPADIRGVSPFLAAVNTVIDLQEVDAAVVDLTKIAARIGIVFESAAGTAEQSPTPVDGPFAFKPKAATTSSPTVTTPPTVPRYVEEVYGGPAAVHTPPGVTTKFLNADRDVPSYDETRGAMLQKIAMAIGLPPTMLFGLFTGRFGGTGPSIRLTIGDSHVWRTRRLKKRVPFVKLDYARRLAWAIARKEVPAPRRSVAKPFRVQPRFSEAYTIDIGRNTNEDKIRLGLGATSLKRLAAERGQDAVTTMTERLEELEWMHNEALRRGLPLSLVFPDTGASAAAETAVDQAPGNVEQPA